MRMDEMVKKALQLKITLSGIEPKIWRKFLVEDTMTFHELHQVIQQVIGWTDSHLYEFKVDGEKIGIPDTRFDRDCLDARKTDLSFLKAKQKFYYVYDFGDFWEHVLVLEKILEKDVSQTYPRCLAGERACPPEDCGSIPGYFHLQEVKEDKKHPEYGKLINGWLGEDWGFEYFNIDEVNRELAKVFFKKVKIVDSRKSGRGRT